MRNYYRIGITAEGSLLTANNDTFHGVLIGGNFAALYKNWLSTFLQKLRKPYFLDPRTEGLARDLTLIQKDGEFRSSFDKLINHFDTVAKNKYLSTRLKRGKLSPDDFIESTRPKKWNLKLINILVNGTLALQDNILNLDSNSNNKSIKKYMKILEEIDELDGELKRVEFLVAPYFYFPTIQSPWFEINVKLLDTTIKKSGRDVYCVLCFDPESINSQEIDTITKKFRNASGFLIWLNNFHETRVDQDLLKKYVKIATELKKTGKPVINLYAGYFTLALENIGIDGYCRGIGISDGRDVDLPASGGGTPNRYYLRQIHNFVVEETIIKILSRNPDLRCKCEICKKVAEQVISKTKPQSSTDLANAFITKLKPNEFKSHFMQSHKQEIDHILLDNPNIKNELQDEINDSSKRRLRDLDVRLTHLERWFNSLP